MEEPNSNDKPASTSPVMDVVSPKPVGDTSSVATPITVTDSSSSDSSSTPETEAPAPVDDTSTSPAEDTPVTINPMAISSTTPVKHGAPKGAVIAAVVVAVLLIAVAAVAFMKTNNDKNKPKTTNNSSTTAQTAPITPKATVSDVDTTTKEVDSALSTTNETTDFNSTDLTDATLGL